MVSLIVKIEAKNEKIFDVEILLKKLVTIAGKQFGVLTYSLCRDSDHRNLFIIYESWVDQEAFQRHATSPDVERITLQVKPLLETPPTARFLEMIATLDDLKD